MKTYKAMKRGMQLETTMESTKNSE